MIHARLFRTNKFSRAFRGCVLSAALTLIARIAHGQPDPQSDKVYQEALKETDPAKSVVIAIKALQLAKKRSDKETLFRCYSLIAGQYLKLKLPDSAAAYVRRGLSMQGGFRSLLSSGDLMMTLGMAEHQKGRYLLAKLSYQEARTDYIKGHDDLSTAIADLNIGICEKQFANYREAITGYLRACKVFETLKDSSYLATAYNSIALCFVSLKQYAKAVDYNKSTLNIRNRLHDTTAVAQSLNNLGFAFNGNGQPDSARLYLNRCIELRVKTKDTSGLALPFQNMGYAMRLKGDWKAAENYVIRSLGIARRYKLYEDQSRADLDLSVIYGHSGYYDKALAHIAQTLLLAKQLKLPELLIEAYGTQAKLFFDSGNIKRAFEATNLQQHLKDSVFTSEKDKRINELEIQYQTRQRQKDITALHIRNDLQGKIVRQQRLSIFALIAIAILLLALFSVAIYNYRLKIIAYKQIRLLMKDLHHRVKNNLQLLSGMFALQLESSEDESTKTTLLQNESRLSAMNLIHKQLYIEDPTMQIDMQTYLQDLCGHLKNAYGDSDKLLSLTLERFFLPADQAIAIGLIVNELVTNAFKYAFDNGKGMIKVSLSSDGIGKIKLCVADNGKGMPAGMDGHAGSFGLTLVNLMATQLRAVVKTEHSNGLSYDFTFSC